MIQVIAAIAEAAGETAEVAAEAEVGGVGSALSIGEADSLLEAANEGLGEAGEAAEVGVQQPGDLLSPIEQANESLGEEVAADEGLVESGNDSAEGESLGDEAADTESSQDTEDSAEEESSDKEAEDTESSQDAEDSAEEEFPDKGAEDTESSQDAEDSAEGESSDKEAEDTESSQDTEDSAEGESSDKEAEDTESSQDAEDSAEEESLSDEEIDKRQCEAIKEGIKKLLKGELTNAEKGNLTEMMMDQYYKKLGYKPIQKDRVTSLDQKGHQGLDGVYEKDGKYIIADAKYGQSPLGDTLDGKQMSDDWALGDRLDESVGKEKADQIREAYENGDVSKEIYHVDIGEDGNSVIGETKQVDSDGSIIRNSTKQAEVYEKSEVNQA